MTPDATLCPGAGPFCCPGRIGAIPRICSVISLGSALVSLLDVSQMHEV